MLPSRRLRNYVAPPPRLIFTVNERRSPIDAQTLDDIARRFKDAWKNRRNPILLNNVELREISNKPLRNR